MRRRMPAHSQIALFLAQLMAESMGLFPHSGMMTRKPARAGFMLQNRRLMVRLLVISADERSAIVVHPHDLAGMTKTARCPIHRSVAAGWMSWHFVLAVNHMAALIVPMPAGAVVLALSAVDHVPLFGMMVVFFAHMAGSLVFWSGMGPGFHNFSTLRIAGLL